MSKNIDAVQLHRCLAISRVTSSQTWRTHWAFIENLTLERVCFEDENEDGVEQETEIKEHFWEESKEPPPKSRRKGL